MPITKEEEKTQIEILHATVANLFLFLFVCLSIARFQSNN